MSYCETLVLEMVFACMVIVKGLHNKLAIKQNRVTLLNSRFKLVKFLVS
jgi:hypothetical protein